MKQLAYTELVLTCPSWQAAQDIADWLVKKGLLVESIPLPIDSAGQSQGVKVILQGTHTQISELRPWLKKHAPHAMRTKEVAVRLG